MGNIKNKFTNAIVSKEFNSILSAHALFQGDNYKLISPCHYLLNKIHADCVFKELEFTPLYHKYIQGKFRPYNVNYRPYIEALMELGLLEIKKNANGTEMYFHAENPEDSRCKQYRVTDKCAELLRDANREYLRRLHDDPQLKRHVRRNKTQQCRRFKPTGDLVIDNAVQNLFRLHYSPQEAEDVKKRLITTADGAEHAQRRIDNAEHTLRHIENGDIWVKRCPTDGRSHNTWTLMNSNLRQIFQIHYGDKILFPTHIIDIRAAHPTFFGVYSKNIYLKHYYCNKYNKSSLYCSSLIYSHYPTDIEASFKWNLIAEVERWNELWTNPTIDPRNIIAKSIGTTKDHVKDLINTAINDARHKNKLHLWIEANFPFLHSVWSRTAINETGNNISRLYESPLFRDNRLQAFVNGMAGIKVMDEHDGLTVFTALDDAEASNKAKIISNFLVDSCRAKFGIKPVIKIEELAKWN